MIYRITDKREWQQAQEAGKFSPADLENNGFVHCCVSDQIDDVAKREFPGRRNLFLLEIDDSALQVEVRWENQEGSDAFYPHVYGPIPLEAIAQVTEFRTDPPRA